MIILLDVILFYNAYLKRIPPHVMDSKNRFFPLKFVKNVGKCFVKFVVFIKIEEAEVYPFDIFSIIELENCSIDSLEIYKVDSAIM